jgi:hypothetical protein
MESIGAHLGTLGYIGRDWSRSGVLGAGETAKAILQTSGPGRLVLVAIAEDHQANLDLTVTGPQRELTVTDDATDRRAVVEIATSAGALYFSELTNASVDCETRYLLRAFAAHAETEPAPLFGLFDHDPARKAIWEDVSRRMSASGYRSLGEVETIQAARGERLTTEVDLVRERCYMFVAQGSPGIDRLALRLNAGDDLIAADLAERPVAWVAHCAEKSGPAQLTTVVLAGSGEIRSARFASWRQELGDDIGPPLLAQEPPMTLAGARRWNDQQLRRRGYEPGEVLIDGKLHAGDRLGARVDIARGECAMFSAISGQGVSDLDLEVSAGDKRMVAADSTPGPAAMVPMCSARGGEYEAEIIARGGNGKAVMLINRLPRVKLPVAPAKAPRSAREAAAVFQRFSLEVDSRVAPLERATAGSGHAFTAEIRLAKGRCYGIAAATDGAGIAELRLRDASGNVTAQWLNDGTPAMIALCPVSNSRLSLEIVLVNDSTSDPPLVLLFASSTL